MPPPNFPKAFSKDRLEHQLANHQLPIASENMVTPIQFLIQYFPSISTTLSCGHPLSPAELVDRCLPFHHALLDEVSRSLSNLTKTRPLALSGKKVSHIEWFELAKTGRVQPSCNIAMEKSTSFPCKYHQQIVDVLLFHITTCKTSQPQ